MPRERYAWVQRLIHWTVALLVVALLAIGFTLGTLGFEGARDAFGIDVTNLLYRYHKTFGVIVLGLMTLRLLLRLAKPPPPYDPPIPSVFRTVGRINHWALYALLLAQPVVGWTATAAGGFPIEFFGWKLPPLLSKDEALSETLYGVHEAFGFAIVALVLLHASAALMHWLVRRDGVMHRMTFG